MNGENLLNDMGFTKRLRNWAFTCQNVPEGVKETDVGLIIVGPAEKDESHLMLQHGMFIAKTKAGQTRTSGIGKMGLVKLLQKNGVRLITYIGKLKTKPKQYFEYMMKQVAEWPQWAKELYENEFTGRQTDQRLMFLRDEFSKKPTYNEWEKACCNLFGFQFSKDIIRTSYKQWPLQKSDFINRLVSGLERRRAHIATGKDMLDLFYTIFNNVTSVHWMGNPVSHETGMLALAFAMLEGQSCSIELSPHFLFEGEAGSGKTLLGQICFPIALASQMPNDAKGVGQMSMASHQHIIKIDDAGDAFWDSNEILSAIYTMYHNDWEAKIHGAKQSNKATCCVITTNQTDSIGRFILAGVDLKGAQRRFLIYKFKGNLNIPHKLRFTDDSYNEFTELLFKDVYNLGNINKDFSESRRILRDLIVEEEQCSKVLDEETNPMGNDDNREVDGRPDNDRDTESGFWEDIPAGPHLPVGERPKINLKRSLGETSTQRDCEADDKRPKLGAFSGSDDTAEYVGMEWANEQIDKSFMATESASQVVKQDFPETGIDDDILARAIAEIEMPIYETVKTLQ